MFIRHIPLYLAASVIFLLAACKTVVPETNTVSNVAIVEPAPTPVIKPIPKPIKVGLALGGGAARGFAHVGVIKALESQGINVEIIAGTSAGSLVGALYAAGNNGFALQKIALQMDEATISDWSVPLFANSTGLLKGVGLQNYVNKEVKQAPIEKLKKTFGAVATDLNTGNAVLFRRGNTGMAVRASSAVPGVFQPVKIGDKLYVDGGLVAPVPVKYAREMGADFVIAVNISAHPDIAASSSSLTVLLQSFSIMGQTINQHELKNADIVIRPELPDMKGNDFEGRHLAILAGERAAMQAMSEIKKKLNELQSNYSGKPQ